MMGYIVSVCLEKSLRRLHSGAHFHVKCRLLNFFTRLRSLRKQLFGQFMSLAKYFLWLWEVSLRWCTALETLSNSFLPAWQTHRVQLDHVELSTCSRDYMSNSSRPTGQAHSDLKFAILHLQKSDHAMQPESSIHACCESEADHHLAWRSDDTFPAFTPEIILVNLSGLVDFLV